MQQNFQVSVEYTFKLCKFQDQFNAGNDDSLLHRSNFEQSEKKSILVKALPLSDSFRKNKRTKKTRIRTQQSKHSKIR